MLRRPGRQDGYSIVELMVAITVFALVFAAVSLGIGRALDLNRGNRNRSVGAYLATRQLEEVRARAFDAVALGRTTCTYTTASCNLPAPYTVTQDVTWTAPGSTTSSCNVPTGGGSLAYKRVTVTVTWPNMRGVAPVTSQTLLTPPSGSYDPNEGHVLVQLYDRNAAPLAGQTVTLTGPESATQPTTAEGCVFFAYLEPGDYDVTLNTSGYVGRQGDQPATQTVAVQAGQISNLQFDYDRAASLQLTLVAPAQAEIPPGIPLTVANSNLTNGTLSFPGTGTTRTITPLFPFASGYQVWTGDCADADPGPPTYPSGSRPAALASNPGATTTGGTAVLDAVDVVVRRVNFLGQQVAVNSATVSAIHTGGPGCPGGLTLTAGTLTSGGGRLRLALPYGAWRIQATGGGRTGSATITLDPVSTTVPTLVVMVS